MNRKLNYEINTVFMMPHEKYTHISSSIIKEVFSLGGDIAEYIPESVLLALNKKYASQNIQYANQNTKYADQNTKCAIPTEKNTK